MQNPQSIRSADWVSRAQQGDAGAFEQLVQEYDGYVHHLLLKTLHNADDAADVAQDVWLTVSLALHGIEDPARFRSWLSRLTLNAAFDFLRKSRRRPRLVALADEDGAEVHADPHAADPSEQILALDTRARMWAALAALPERYRQAVVLREYAGYSYEAIARTLGVSRSAAETLASRGRRRLASTYERATHLDSQPASECTRVLQCFADIAEGTLSRRESDGLRRHADECPACAGWLGLIEGVERRRSLHAVAIAPWDAVGTLLEQLTRASGAAARRLRADFAGRPIAPILTAYVGQMAVVVALAALSLAVLSAPIRVPLERGSDELAASRAAAAERADVLAGPAVGAKEDALDDPPASTAPVPPAVEERAERRERGPTAPDVPEPAPASAGEPAAPAAPALSQTASASKKVRGDIAGAGGPIALPADSKAADKSAKSDKSDKSGKAGPASAGSAHPPGHASGQGQLAHSASAVRQHPPSPSVQASVPAPGKGRASAAPAQQCDGGGRGTCGGPGPRATGASHRPRV